LEAEASETLDAFDVCPAIRRFVQADALELQIDAVVRVIDAGENPERLGCKIFDGWNTVEHDGFMVGHGLKKAAYFFIACIDDKRVVPLVDQVFHGEGFDVGEVHHHAAIRRAFGFDEFALQRDFEHVTMAVQVTALAAVIGDAVARIEFEFSGNRQHGRSGNVQVLVGLHRQAPLWMALVALVIGVGYWMAVLRTDGRVPVRVRRAVLIGAQEVAAFIGLLSLFGAWGAMDHDSPLGLSAAWDQRLGGVFMLATCAAVAIPMVQRIK